jgi:hypothetical protein
VTVNQIIQEIEDAKSKLRQAYPNLKCIQLVMMHDHWTCQLSSVRFTPARGPSQPASAWFPDGGDLGNDFLVWENPSKKKTKAYMSLALLQPHLQT